jgi:hypothetical protein
MKQILISILVAVATQQAHAVVADKFNCELKLVENGNQDEISQQMEFTVARVPAFQIPIPFGSTTVASFDARLESKTKKRTMTANVTFFYHHAIRTDSAGRHPEARQSSCGAITVSLCDYGTGNPKEGDYQICHEGKSACSVSQDPFNPTSGWAEVSLAPDGTPLFDERILVPVNEKFYDDNKVERGTVKFKCDYKGTYT